ncbi:MAG: LysM peptidoglycan-binding domain-containing protein [Victivallales bacterium]|nr:LysM peptidoglycan-binding domain-containing protein [Victivallales bacterium]
MKNKWINLAIACGVAVTFATGCATKRQQPQPNTRDLLRNRDLVPPPFSSPDAVKGFAPAPSSPAAPGMPMPQPRRASSPVAPGNVAAQDSLQPAIPNDTLFVPAADNGPAPAVTSLFGNGQPQLVAVTSDSKTATTPQIINRPVRPAIITPSVIQPPAGSPKAGTATAHSASPATGHSASPAPAAGGAQRTVVVKAGDTLSGIAYQYGITTQSLANANNITDPSKIRIGQKLVLPSTALAKPRAPQAKSSKATATTTKGAGQTASATAAAAAPKDGTHIVKAGDSLWTIAKAHHIKFNDIQAWNPSAVDKPLKIGQVIIIKAPAGASDKQDIKPEEKKADEKKADDKQSKVVTPVQPVLPQPVAPTKAAAGSVVIGPIPTTPEPAKADTPAPKAEAESILNHTVQDGDTLDKIALMYGAVTPAEVAQKVNDIKAKNPTIQSDKDLKVGIIIRVPFTPVTP